MNLTVPRKFYRVARVTTALGVKSKHTVRARARREGWWQRQESNRIDVCPPPEIAARIPEPPPSRSRPPVVMFSQLASAAQRERALLRQRAVEHYLRLLRKGTPKMVALVRTVGHFHRAKVPFMFSWNSLHAWASRFQNFGLNGLVSQRQGKGRRAKGKVNNAV
jgi:hypothetical protein